MFENADNPNSIFSKESRRADAQKVYSRHMRNYKIAKAATLICTVATGVRILAENLKERRANSED